MASYCSSACPPPYLLPLQAVCISYHDTTPGTWLLQTPWLVYLLTDLLAEAGQCNYHIEGNFGGSKLWRIAG